MQPRQATGESVIYSQEERVQADNPRKLGDKYVLLDLIGVGGMAEVYRAKLIGEKGFEKQIVIKKLLPQVARDQEMVRLFIGEARLAALLQHENIAATYDFGEIDGDFFLAMEYLSGIDLHSLLQRARDLGIGLAPKYSLMIAAQICEGMESAHRLKDLQGKPLNVIHRDLTPHNIFITYDGKIKIFDFGVAKAEILDNRTRAGVVKGKVSYMSPEQMSGDDIDFRSDIFSIGILLYEMLSGRRMYSGDTAALIRKCITAEYDRLEDVVPGLPAEIYLILHKALELKPELRYQSCLDMQADIEDLLFNMKERPGAQSLKLCVRELFTDEYQAKQNNTLSGGVMGHARPQLSRSSGTSATEVLPQPAQKSAIPRWQDRRFLFMASLGIVALAIFLVFSIFNRNEPNQAPQVERAAHTASSAPAEQVTGTARLGRPSPTPPEQVNLAEVAKAAKLETDRIKAEKIRKAEERQRKAQLRAEKKRLKQTGDRYAKEAETALSEGRLADALKLTATGLSESPGHKKLTRLRARASEAGGATIIELEKKARQRFTEDDLTTPEGDSAFYYYSEIAKLDPESDLARNGFRDIADRYAKLAESAYRNMDFPKAELYVTRGLEVVPGHFRLEALKTDLARSSPEKVMKSLQKTFNFMLSD
jgi:serine/threonine protein kinase